MQSSSYIIPFVQAQTECFNIKNKVLLMLRYLSKVLWKFSRWNSSVFSCVSMRSMRKSTTSSSSSGDMSPGDLRW